MISIYRMTLPPPPPHSIERNTFKNYIIIKWVVVGIYFVNKLLLYYYYFTCIRTLTTLTGWRNAV